MRDVDLAYLAGVIDSDGYISAQKTTHKGRKYFGAAVGIAGTRREPHDLAASFFGGKVCTYYPKGDRAHHRPQFQWQRYGETAVPVILAVLPYLRVKRLQAQLALDLQEALAEARAMRGHDDPFPWFGPDYDPSDDLAAMAGEVRSLNIRGYRGRARSDFRESVEAGLTENLDAFSSRLDAATTTPEEGEHA